MKKTTTLLLMLLIVGCVGITKLNGQSIAAETALNKADNTFFIENKGQWPEEVLYLTRIGGLDAWITKEGVVYDFYKMKEVEDTEQSNSPFLEEAVPGMEQVKEMQRYGQVVVLQLQKSKTPALKPAQKQDGYYNYFLGNDEHKWASYVGLYKEIRLENVYDGIDMKYYFDRGNLRYDYIVKPGGDPNVIQFALDGANDQYIKSTGELVFDIRFGAVEQKELMLYQIVDGNKMEVEGKFIINMDSKSIGFDIATFDQSKELIIDPLVYSTFLGGNLNEAGNDIVVESDHAYIAGYTRSSNFPTTEGAYENVNINYDYDVFITKLTPDGSGLVYSTYLGGLQKDFMEGMVVESGHVYISGETESPDYPTTRKAYDVSHNGYYDVFVTKLNSDGSGLVYSTFLGGTYSDHGEGIAVEDGHAYITGTTTISSNFPTTPGAFDESCNEGGDTFVTKLTKDGDELVYSTYLGGSYGDAGRGIAVDAFGQAYVTGETSSEDFPTTSGAYMGKHSIYPTNDVFVTKLNSSGSGLEYSTYLGGKSYDYVRGIALDASGNVFVTGRTKSVNFPTTLGAYKETRSEHSQNDAFVTKLNNDGSDLVYSTFLGGSDGSYGFSIAVDASGNAYVTGSGGQDFPTTPGAYDESYNAGSAFITKFNYDGSGLEYSTFLGEYILSATGGIAVDASGNAYVTGITRSPDFPTTPGAYDESINVNSWDTFITKLNSSGSGLEYSTFLGGSSYDYVYVIAVDASGNAYVTGRTGSSDFPTTPGAYDESYNGGSDIFITKLNSSGSGLVYSTYLGGDLTDHSRGIAVDASGYAYVTGNSKNYEVPFPTTEGAYDESDNGFFDVIVTKINLQGLCAGPQIICPPDVRIECDESTDPANTGMALSIGGCGDVSFTFSDVTTTPASTEDYYTITRTWIATDENGNTSSCDQTITVNPCSCLTEDNTDPVLTVVSGPITIWPPNHKYKAINVHQLFVSVTDNCVDLTVNDVYIVSVTSDEEEDAPGNDDGNTLDDIVISSACDAVYLRVERNKNGNGRVYTINLAVDDGNGNTGTAACQVHVPISKDVAAIEDDVAYGEECGGLKSSFIVFTDDDIQLTNYPNPFNGNTTITFTLIETNNTTLKVYNTFGQEVATLFDGMAESGQQYSLNFSSGNLPKGIYLYHIQSGNKVSVIKKMILIK